ncbi:MAG TPA: hypothetical protein VF103_07160 [Polyangiaceae bacterium]
MSTGSQVVLGRNKSDVGLGYPRPDLMRRHALFGLLLLACGETSPAHESGTPNEPSGLRPVVASDFWQIAASPDLGVYDNRPAQQPVDFGIWRAGDGTWQLWSCIRGANVEGGTRLFYRWEGVSLTQADWIPGGIALQSEPSLGELPGCLQAPHVVRIGNEWHMVYGDCEHICHAVSSDGKAFERVIQPSGVTGMFGEGPGQGTRDPMLFVAESEYRVYYTAGEGVDYVRTSSDLASWSAPTVVARGGSAGIYCCAAECPFVIRPVAGGDFFLFRTQRYGEDAQTSIYRSKEPFDFGIDSDEFLIGTLPLAAPEIIELDGQWFIAALRADLQGIQIARLAWERE